MTDRLYRSPTDRVIAGVAGGLAVWLNVDPSLVRVVWVLLAIMSGGLFVIVYLVMMIVIPLPPVGWVPRTRGAAGWPGWSPGTPGPGAVPGWDPGTPAGTTADGMPGEATQTGWTVPPEGVATPAPPRWTASRAQPGSAGIVVGLVLVLLGAWFLVDQYIKLDWQVVWPVVIIVLGALLVVAAVRLNRPDAG